MWVETMTIVFRVPEERFVLFTKISIFRINIYHLTQILIINERNDERSVATKDPQ